jgi:hypothetical protein
MNTDSQCPQVQYFLPAPFLMWASRQQDALTEKGAV